MMGKLNSIAKNYFGLLISISLVVFTTQPALAQGQCLRGHLLHFLNDSGKANTGYQYFADGVLIIQDGKIQKAGSWQALKSDIPTTMICKNYPNGLILPGFIDTHIHYPQLDMIAADSGGHLLQWLNHYTFPFEKKFQDPQYAEDVSTFFLDELIRNGTTTAMVFTTVYPHAVDSLFKAAQARHMRIIAGEVLGDRNLPSWLKQNPEKAAQETEQLIKKWHNKPDSRLLYAITFRFAPTTSPQLFQKIGSLRKDYPDTYVYTHISENREEIAWSKQLFGVRNYLDIYAKYNLLGNKTLLAHGVYLTEDEERLLNRTSTAIAFCPTSNLFLGSGLFDLEKAKKNRITVGLGSDVGAGTSFSLLQTLNEAYKVAQMQNQRFTAFDGFYLATLGGAKALNLESKLGNFLPGKEADFVVLNFEGSTPLLKRRLTFAQTLSEKLFVLMTLGDDRSIMATYVNGELASSSESAIR